MHLRKHFSTFVLSGVLAAAVPFCMAQHPKEGQAAAHPSRSMASANQRAADLLNTINKTEIAGAQNIQDHVDDPNVKSFAQDLVNDHKNLQTQLEDAAAKAKIHLREGATTQKQERRMDERWDKEKPAAAAHSFVAAQIRGHRHAVRQLQHLEPQITDPQLKTVVQDAIPVLQKHLTEAEKLQSQLKGGKAGGLR